MMGTSTVTIANKKNVSVSVTLYYAVSLVNISLEDIPANVKKVRSEEHTSELQSQR